MSRQETVALLYCLNKALVRAVLQRTTLVKQLNGDGTLPIAELLTALIAFRRIGGLGDMDAPLLDSVVLTAPSRMPAQTQLQPLVDAATTAGVSKLTLSNVVLRARCTRSYSPLTVDCALADIQRFSSLQTLELDIVLGQARLAGQPEPMQLAALSALPCLQQLALCCSLSWGALNIQVPALRQVRTLTLMAHGPVAASVFFQGFLPALTELRLDTRRTAQVGAFSPLALPALGHLMVTRSPPTCQPGLLLVGVQLLQLHSHHPVRARHLAALAAALPALHTLLLPTPVWRCIDLPLSSVRILIMDRATEEDLVSFCNRLSLFPNLVLLYLNRPQVEVRGSLEDEVVRALRCQQPLAQHSCWLNVSAFAVMSLTKAAIEK
ncbi:hypothetical protein N2152v2_008852 [Parachlorella kessleri]